MAGQPRLGRRRPVGDRLMEKVARNDAGCWVWTGCRLPSGYGRISIGRETFNAHRVSYELFVGPIAHGLEIDHTCRNKSCVNPAHLEAVTHVENIRRHWAAVAS